MEPKCPRCQAIGRDLRRFGTLSVFHLFAPEQPISGYKCKRCGIRFQYRPEHADHAQPRPAA